MLKTYCEFNMLLSDINFVLFEYQSYVKYLIISPSCIYFL